MAPASLLSGEARSICVSLDNDSKFLSGLFGDHGSPWNYHALISSSSSLRSTDTRREGDEGKLIPHGIYRHLKATRLLIQVQRGRVRRV